MAVYFLTTIGQVATLFMMMAVGYVLAKIGKLSEKTLPQISFLLMYIICPCLIISIMQIERTPESVEALWKSIVMFGAIYALTSPFAPVVFRKQPSKTREVLQFGSLYGNVGFIGIPLINMIYGAEGMLYCVPSIVCYNLFVWTHGSALIGGREHAKIKNVLLNPGIIAIAIGAVLFFSGLTLPAPLKSAIDYIGNMNTPVSLILIGGQMASTHLVDTFRDGRLYSASAVKLLVVPAIAAAVLYPFASDPMMYCVTVMSLACPAAGLTSIFAQWYDRDFSVGARFITLSTLLSGITAPLWATVMLALTGVG